MLEGFFNTIFPHVSISIISWSDLLFFAFIDDDFIRRPTAFFSNFSHDMANQDAILYHQTETKSMSHEFHVDPLIMQFRSWCYSINSDCHLGQQRMVGN